MTKAAIAVSDDEFIATIMHDWQLDCDLRRAKQIVNGAKQSPPPPTGATLRQLALHLDDLGHLEGNLRLDGEVAFSESGIGIPTGPAMASDQSLADRSTGIGIGRFASEVWNPIVFASAGLAGGSVALIVQQIAPPLFPALIFVQLALGIWWSTCFSRREQLASAS